MNRARLIRALLMDMILLGLAGCQSLPPGGAQNQGAAAAGMSGSTSGFAAGQSAAATPSGGVLEPGGSLTFELGTNEITGGGPGEAAAPQPLSVLARKARTAPSADLNGDGFVTIDEVLAMKQAGLTDDEVLDRMRATNQLFAPTLAQQDYLRTHGISNYLIEQMLEINGGQKQQVLSAPGSGRKEPPGRVISVPPPEPYPPPVPP